MLYFRLGYKYIPSEIAIEVENGILVINGKDVRLMPFEEQSLKYKFAVSYDPKATAPIFRAALSLWLSDKKEQLIFQKHIADALFRANGYPSGKALGVMDFGHNGAETCFACIKPLFGNHATSFPLLGICNEYGGYEAIQMRDSLLNISAGKYSGNCDLEILRRLVSGNPVLVETSLEESFYINPPKFIFSTDTIINSSSFGNCFPYIDRVFMGTHRSLEEKRPYLARIIVERELPGILNWVLEGVQYIFAEKEREISWKIRKR